MKVAIINDSRVAAEVLRRILTELPGFELLWIAYSGEEGIELCTKDHPDIILMDLIMPGIGGAETTRRIMQSTPCVILVVTATTVGNREQVFEAMGYGALDAVNTPTLGPNGDMAGAEPLLQKLRTVSRLVSPHRSHHPPHVAPHVPRAPRTGRSAAAGLPIVAIGASTGGPQALSQILSELPANFPAAVLISQHVDQHFAAGLATWLQHHSALPVEIAKPGERIHGGRVWVAGTGDHLVYEEAGGTVYYTPNPVETAYRPSVDALFHSIAHAHYGQRLGVLLTGMGRDGAEGLLALRKSGGYTIAQDAESSVVYGMPRAAAELKAAKEILPLNSIGSRIRDLILQEQGAVAIQHDQKYKGKP